ncbi:exported hypothetical protein [Mesorhizobium ventifaucium]|uniref:Uncharacterized protein n=1 Tax=Mesorhizobium ventifaucium TaxID=666020 RepID=A0ABM9DV31_9HYPH|nr:exported hypothetical protein [Mesorhizobium ventifaucium]
MPSAGKLISILTVRAMSTFAFAVGGGVDAAGGGPEAYACAGLGLTEVAGFALGPEGLALRLPPGSERLMTRQFTQRYENSCLTRPNSVARFVH